MKTLDVFEARDLNGERAWFFWRVIGYGIGTAIGPFSTSHDADVARTKLQRIMLAMTIA